MEKTGLLDGLIKCGECGCALKAEGEGYCHQDSDEYKILVQKIHSHLMFKYFLMQQAGIKNFTYFIKKYNITRSDFPKETNELIEFINKNLKFWIKGFYSYKRHEPNAFKEGLEQAREYYMKMSFVK